jgi:hypothetical protein
MSSLTKTTINEIISNLDEIDRELFPSFEVISSLLRDTVGENCSDHGLIRNMILKIYFLVKVI